MSHFADYAYEAAALAGRRGPEDTEPPICMHVDVCHENGTEACDCGELICAKHISVCYEFDCGLKLCSACSLESTHDQQRRCISCHRAHNEAMREVAA